MTLKYERGRDESREEEGDRLDDELRSKHEANRVSFYTFR